jgi:UDP-glucose 4-epimerase
MNKIAIIGKNGFVASNLINALKKYKKTNTKIISFSRQKYNLLSVHSVKKINKNIKDADTVVFCSADAPVKNLRQLNNNILMLNNFFNYIDNIEKKFFLYLSSDAVYKDTKNLLNENSEIKYSGSLHGMMHIFRENIVKNFINNKSLCIVRPTLIYGPNDPHNGYGPNKFIRSLLNKEDIVLFGRGEEKRDHIFIDDLSKIIAKLIIKKRSGIFNIASGKVISFFEIAKIIKKTLNSKNKIIFKKRFELPHHLGLRRFNVSKIKKVLKIRQIVDLKNYLSDINNIKSYCNSCFRID